MGRGLGFAVGVAAILLAAVPASAQNGLLGEYYPVNPPAASPAPPPGSPAGGAATTPVAGNRIDAVVDFGFATPPVTGLTSNDGFMVAWSGFLTNTTGAAISATFQVRADDGIRLWVNGTAVINQWVDQAPVDVTGTTPIAIGAGARVSIRLEFYENAGGEECRLRWDPAGGTAFVIIPTGNLTPPDPPAPPVITVASGFNPITGFPFATVSWGAVAGATSYLVERSTTGAGGAFTQIGTTTTTSFSDPSVQFNQQFCYRVRSAAGGGLIQSAPSNVVCITVTPPPPRLNDHDEGLWNDKCSCGSVTAMGPGAAWLIAPLALALAFLRRR